MLKKTACLILLLVSGFATSAQRNVILIIADDLGTDYLGFYENHMDTVGMPNIRRLLDRGIRFTRAWSNPLCSPTRAGVFTGRYSFRTGVGAAVKWNSAELDTDEITIPRLLTIYAPNAIAKANIGKWHLQYNIPATNYFFPNLMGYDYYEGPFIGALNTFYNWTKVTNGVPATVTNYATTETTNNAIAWIKVNQQKPFFLWLAYNAPHTPYHLPPYGLYSDTVLSGSAAHINANPEKYFKASVEALDHEMGRLFDTLQYIQKWDSTDVIFISDNGTDQLVEQTTGNGKAKGSIYQAGVSVPFIISGPSVVNPGRVSNALVNTHDLFATILELFGNNTWQNHIPWNKPVDSKSIIPIIRNQTSTIRPWVFTEVFGATPTGDGKAMRNLDYKLLDFDSGGQKMFNLTLDPLELHDLLIDTLSATDSANYKYLCSEMTKLTRVGRYCTLFGGEDLLEYSDENKPGIYPNPFNSSFLIEPKTGNELFELTDCFGQLIYSGKNIEAQNFSYLAKGIYYLKVIDSSTSVIKLLKE